MGNIFCGDLFVYRKKAKNPGVFSTKMFGSETNKSPEEWCLEDYIWAVIIDPRPELRPFWVGLLPQCSESTVTTRRPWCPGDTKQISINWSQVTLWPRTWREPLHQVSGALQKTNDRVVTSQSQIVSTLSHGLASWKTTFKTLLMCNFRTNCWQQP